MHLGQKFFLKETPVYFYACVLVYFESPGEAGDNAGPSIVKKPKMIKTANGYKCTTCNRVFSQKGNYSFYFTLFFCVLEQSMQYLQELCLLI